MALIIFVSSSSVASNYARLRGETFNANSELTGLGLANMAGGFFQALLSLVAFRAPLSMPTQGPKHQLQV